MKNFIGQVLFLAGGVLAITSSIPWEGAVSVYSIGIGLVFLGIGVFLRDDN